MTALVGRRSPRRSSRPIGSRALRQLRKSREVSQDEPAPAGPTPAPPSEPARPNNDYRAEIMETAAGLPESRVVGDSWMSVVSSGPVNGSSRLVRVDGPRRTLGSAGRTAEGGERAVGNDQHCVALPADEFGFHQMAAADRLAGLSTRSHWREARSAVNTRCTTLAAGTSARPALAWRHTTRLPGKLSGCPAKLAPL